MARKLKRQAKAVLLEQRTNDTHQGWVWLVAGLVLAMILAFGRPAASAELAVAISAPASLADLEAEADQIDREIRAAHAALVRIWMPPKATLADLAAFELFTDVSARLATRLSSLTEGSLVAEAHGAMLGRLALLDRMLSGLEADLAARINRERNRLLQD